jgi:hypothetical protein
LQQKLQISKTSPMEMQNTENLLVKMYSELDDLLQDYQFFLVSKGEKFERRKTLLSDAETGTILAMYHLFGYKCFKYYYEDMILGRLKSWFPNAPQYKVFLRYTKMSWELMHLWLLFKIAGSKKSGTYFIDSKKLEVCHLKRAHQHQVFKDVAHKGKTSTGWFYGLKVHLVINDLGEIMAFEITPGNVADNNRELLKRLLDDLQGICVGDKGYQSALFECFYEKSLHLLVKPKKNAKKKVPEQMRLVKLSRKRALIESVFDILSSVLDIEHSRHRSSTNGFVNILSALVAYQYREQKPSLPTVSKRNYRIAAA